MRKYALLAAAAGLAVSGSMARADFVISSTRAASSTPGFDVVKFYVLNNGTGSTTGSTGLLGVDVAMVAPTSLNGSNFAGNGLMINTTDFEGSGTNDDADLAGTSSPTASYVRFGGATQFTTLPQLQGVQKAQGGAVSDPTDDSYTQGQLVHAIHVAGFTASPVKADSSLNGGKGAQFAQAFVPTGDPVEILNPGSDPTFATQSNFGSDLTPAPIPASNATTAPYVDGGPTVPEPASLSLLGLGLGALIVRRAGPKPENALTAGRPW